MTTVITGFIDITKYGSLHRKPLMWYLEYVKDFTLKVPLPLVVFIEKEHEEFILKERKNLLTKICIIDSLEFVVLYRYKLKSKGESFSPEYIVAINLKEYNYFNSGNFMQTIDLLTLEVHSN